MRAVVNVSLGSWYPRGTDRLVESLDRVGCTPADASRDFIWRDALPPGGQTHAENPYEFKVRALEVARDAGARAALWCDSSVWFVKHPDAAFERVERDGYYFMSEGWNVCQWCVDGALPLLGVTREEAVGMDMVSAIFYGLDPQSGVGRDVIALLRRYADNGAYRGPWRLPGVAVTNDPRGVFGHRHDQTALSVIIARLGLKMEKPSTLFLRKPPAGQPWVPSDSVVATAQGGV